MRLSAGELNQRIEIQRRGTAENALGEVVDGWSTLTTVPAKAKPLSGRELFAASQSGSQARVVFTIRYRPGLSDDSRVIWRGQPYDVVEPPVLVDGRTEFVELMCMNGVRDGR